MWCWCRGISDHWPLKCLFNSLFWLASKVYITGPFFEGNPPVTGGFPSQRAGSIPWRYNVTLEQGPITQVVFELILNTLLIIQPFKRNRRLSTRKLPAQPLHLSYGGVIYPPFLRNILSAPLIIYVASQIFHRLLMSTHILMESWALNIIVTSMRFYSLFLLSDANTYGRFFIKRFSTLPARHRFYVICDVYGQSEWSPSFQSNDILYIIIINMINEASLKELLMLGLEEKNGKIMFSL